MHLLRRRQETMLLPVGLATLAAAFLCAWLLGTDRLYTHLFYVPIAWCASRTPRYTMLLGGVFAASHLLIELVLRGSLEPTIWLRAMLVLTVSLMLQRIWRHERSYRNTVSALDFQRHHDSLTGVFNRRYFTDSLRPKLAYPVAFHLCDLDNLKGINDLYGHATGDRYLQRMAMTLLRGIRTEDSLIRIGGDEFLIVSQGCDPHQKQSIHARMLELLERETHLKPDESGLPEPLSFSVGSGYAERAEDVDAAIGEADRAMYGHKRDRRHPGSGTTKVPG